MYIQSKQKILYIGDSDLMSEILKAYHLETEDGKRELTEDEKLEAAEEFLARLGETGGHSLSSIFAEHQAEIKAWALKNKYDIHDLTQLEKYTRFWIEETGFKPEKPSAVKRFISKIRLWLRERGWFVSHLSDDDLVSIISRSIRAGMAKRKKGAVVKQNLTTGQRASIALEEEQDLDIKQAFPKYSSFQAEAKLLELSKQDIKNRETGDKAQINKTQRKKILSTAAVEKSIANGFTEEDHLLAAANIKDLYENALLLTADPDLKNNDTAIIIKRYVAPLVLQSEENQIADVLITQKVSLDKKTERIYSLEIEEIVPEIKSQSGMRPDSGSQSTGRSLAHRNYPAEVVNKLQQKHAKIKSFLEKNTKKYTRSSVAPDIDTPAFKNWFADSKAVDQDGKPLGVYHGTNWQGWEFDKSKPAWFSEKEDYAEEMAAQRNGNRVIKAYLSIQNPMFVKVPPNKMADPAFENKIIAEAKSKGHDGVRLETDTNNEIERDVFWVAFDPARQVKSATDNVGTFDVNNPDIRYSVSPEISEWEKYVIELLKPVVGERVEMEKKEIAAKVKELYNVELSEDDANLYAYLAAHQNRSDTARRVIAANKRRAFEFYEDMHPFFYHLRQSGENLVINPGREYIGTEFSGSFISEEFRKYSKARPQGKNESDKAYRRYLDKRKEKLANAEGVSLEQLAQSYADLYGKDPLDVANEMIQFFKDLKTADILSEFKQHKADQLNKERPRPEC